VVKRLIIVAAQKGGIGKTFMCRVLVDTIRRTGRKLSAWDLDGATGSLAGIYAERDPEVGAGIDDVRNPNSSAVWLNAVYGDADDVLLDVPAGALRDLLRTLDAGATGLVAAAKEAGREVVFVSVIGIKKDQVLTAQDAVETFGKSVRHVIVKNGVWGASDEFVIFDGMTMPDGTRRYGVTAEMVRNAGAEVTYLPRLQPRTEALLDEQGLSFVRGIDALDVLGRRHTLNLKGWLESAEAALEGTWLSPRGERSEGGGRRKVS
jgi:hypothetical protein